MALEIQLADVAVLRRAVLCAFLKEVLRRFKRHPRRALQVLLPPDELDVVAGRAAAAVAIAERQQETAHVPFLHAIAPAVYRRLRVGSGGIVHVQEAGHLAAVHALPGEVVVRERVAAVVGPEDLLRRQVLDPAAAQNLRQHGAVAECIRQPQQLAVDAELLFIKPFAVHDLADQRLAGGHVRVRLHPHAAVRDPLARTHLFLDLLVQRGIQRLADFIRLRLALEELVVRIHVHQADLLGKRARHLALRLPVRPQPAHIQMRVADGRHVRRNRAVARGQHGGNRLARTRIVRQPSLARLLIIHQQREALQRLLQLCRAQGVLVLHLQQVGDRAQIEPQLVRRLMPDAERASAHPLARHVLRLGQKVARAHRPRRAAVLMLARVVVPGVGFHQQMEALARLGMQGQHLITDVVMRHTHPLRAARAERLAVHKQRRLAALAQVHHDALPRRLRRQHDLPAHPAVMPLAAPGRSGRHRRKAARLRLLGRKHLRRLEALERDLSQRLVELLLQHVHPVLHAVLPLGFHPIYTPLFKKTPFVVKSVLVMQFFLAKRLRSCRPCSRFP